MQRKPLNGYACLVAMALAIGLLAANGAAQPGSIKLRHGNDWVNNISYSADGKRLVSASLNGTIEMWNSETGKRIWKLDLDAGGTKQTQTISHLYHMAVSPDTRTIAVSFDQSTVVKDVLQADRTDQIALI